MSILIFYRTLLITSFIYLPLFSCKEKLDTKLVEEVPEFALVIHGGAGTIDKSFMTEELEKAYHQSLLEALNIGEKILMDGGKSIDAVVEVIKYLEDSPLFNAGKGAVFTHNGTNELDASIMTGHDQKAGAIAGVKTVKNPITAARTVMEKSEHVLLVGTGAEEFSALNGLEIVDPTYFYTDKSWNSLQKILLEDKQKSQLSKDELDNKKHGTVGCVALDKFGNITSGTSTGGMTNKKFNRVGDAPIIGAGTYADNLSCGISCTGHGEYFIRYTVARDVAAMIEYKGVSLEEAAEYVVNKKLVEKGGAGGLIGLDTKGNIVMKFNTSGMYRGYCKPGDKKTFIYKNE